MKYELPKLSLRRVVNCLSSRNETQVWVIAVLPGVKVSRCQRQICAPPVIREHINGCIYIARYDFLLVFYSDLRLGGTAVELKLLKSEEP